MSCATHGDGSEFVFTTLSLQKLYEDARYTLTYGEGRQKRRLPVWFREEVQKVPRQYG